MTHAVSTRSACEECGASQITGQSCREMFEFLLALEYQEPRAFGAVHHLTVICYHLQHPRGFAATTRDGWRTMLSEILDDEVTPDTLRKRVRARVDGPTRVREPGAEPPASWPRAWPVTVADALPLIGTPADAEGHIERVRRWAAAVRATLDASGPAR